MTQSLYILLAAGALGAPGDGACPCNVAPSGAPGPYVQAAPANGGVLGWVRNLFGQRQPTYQTMPAAQITRPQPAQPIQPAAYAVRPTTVVPPRQSQPPAYSTPQGTIIAPATTVITERPSFEAPALTVAKKYED